MRTQNSQPYNFVTDRDYTSERNIELLEQAREANGWSENAWLTFLQAREIGLMIKKDSKGVTLNRGFGKVDQKDKDTGKVKAVSVPLKKKTVFNIAQTVVFKK